MDALMFARVLDVESEAWKRSILENLDAAELPFSVATDADQE